MSLTKMWGTQDITLMAPRHYVPVCQKSSISKYSIVTTHFKEKFMLDHNQVVKSNKNQHFGCFSLFSQFQAQKWGAFIIYSTLEKYERGSFKISFWIALTYTWDNMRLTDKLRSLMQTNVN